jgi:hypothetical protein
MANFEVLKGLAEAAYARGSAFFSQADGWTEIGTQEGITVSYTEDGQGRTLKVEGDLNKTPQYVAAYIAGNLGTLRSKHSQYSIGTDYLEKFDDNSHIVKESTSHPELGNSVRYSYIRSIDGEAGSVNIVATNAAVPGATEYPASELYLVFFVISLTPNEAGSHLRIAVKAHSPADWDEDKKLELGQDFIAFIGGVIAEIVAAPPG